jgi:hypothetical protein
MTKILAWQDSDRRRRMFDGQAWFDVEIGETCIVIIGRNLDAKVLKALGVATDDKDEAK